MREKITTQASGSATNNAKKLVFYDAMEFLKPHVTLRATSSNVPPPPDDDKNSYVDAAAPDGISTTDITHALDYVGSQQTATNVDVCEGGSRPTPVINQPPCTA